MTSTGRSSSSTESKRQRTLRSRLLFVALHIVIATTVAGMLMPTARAADDPADDPAIRARYQKAKKLIEMKRLIEARAIARSIAAEEPQWVLGWVLLGITYMYDEDDYDLAEEALEHAHKLDKKNPAPLTTLASLEAKRQDTDAAAEYRLQAAKLDEDNVDLQISAARSLVNAKRMAEANQRYDLALDLEPTNLKAVTGFGAMLVEQGKYSRAVEIYRNALERGEDNILLYTNLTDALVRSARYEKAIEAADEGLEVRPNDGLLTMHKVRALTHLGRYDEASTLAQKVIDKGWLTGEQQVFAYYQLGIAHGLQGCGKDKIPTCRKDSGTAPECCKHDEKALEAFEKAHEIRSDFRDVTIRLGLAQFGVGKLEDAEATLKNYIEGKGDRVEAEAFGALAVTLYRFGEPRDVKDAVRTYSEARELAPDFDDGARLEKFRQWPPFAIDVIAELRERADEPIGSGESAEEGGCGCAQVAVGGESSDALPLLFTLIALGLVLRMRSRHGTSRDA